MDHTHRIEKLEHAHGLDREQTTPDELDPEQMTKDELNVAVLELARLPDALDGLPEKTLEEYQAQIAEIEADIIRMARQQASPDYVRHLDWCRQMWGGRNGCDYVPALTGAEGGFGEYDDWNKPNIMQRRAALRERPVVRELLEKAAADDHDITMEELDEAVEE